MTNCQSVVPRLVDELRGAGRDVVPVLRWLEHEYLNVRRYRQQVAEIYPVVANLLTIAPDIPAHLEIAAVIDRGEPFIERVSAILGVSKAAIRALKGKGLTLLGAEWFDHPAELIDYLTQIPVPLQPTSAEDWIIVRRLWVAFADLGHEGQWFSQSRFRNLDRIAGHLMRGCSGKHLRPAEKKLLRPQQGVRPSLVGLRDYFDFVADWCAAGAGIAPAVKYCSDIVGRQIAEEFLVRYSALELVNQSERWHRAVTQQLPTETDERSAIATDEWPPLPGLPMTLGDMTALAITNRLQLTMEGARMEHCASLYYWPCMEGVSHIVSVRDENGDCLSTAEVALTWDTESHCCVYLEQHRGRRNDDPPPPCVNLIEIFMKALQADAMQDALATIAKFHDDRAALIHHLRCEHDQTYFAEAGGYLMRHVLPSYTEAIAWLDERLLREEAIWGLRNQRAAKRMAMRGLEEENTWDYAFERYRENGDDSIFDEGVAFRE